MTQCLPVDILVVDDNDSQRASIVLALEKSIPNVVVIAVENGIEALDFLLSRGAWTDRVGEDPPRLIMLDISLPGASGIHLLGQIRSLAPNDTLALTPVVMFTDSRARGDITESYRHGANSYITKPLSVPDFQAVVESVGRYWINQNQVCA